MIANNCKAAYCHIWTVSHNGCTGNNDNYFFIGKQILLPLPVHLLYDTFEIWWYAALQLIAIIISDTKYCWWKIDIYSSSYGKIDFSLYLWTRIFILDIYHICHFIYDQIIIFACNMKKLHHQQDHKTHYILYISKFKFLVHR